MGVVNDDGPAAVWHLVSRHPRWPVDGAYLGQWIGCDCSGIEGRILDVVAHPAYVVLAHGLDIHQGATVVEPKLAVLGIGHRKPEVHELWGSPDVELEALEDGDHVVADIVEGPLHPSGVDRACGHPFLDRDLLHGLAIEDAQDPGHACSVDELTQQEKLRDQRGELRTIESGVSGLDHREAPVELSGWCSTTGS